MSGAKWTPAEDAMLRELYPTATNRAIGEKLGRTQHAVLQRARALGLRKPPDHPHVMPKRLWTDERAAWFRAFVPGHSESEIIEAFNDRFGVELTRAQVKNGKVALGVKSGTVGGRFQKGGEPFNKGKTWADYMSPEGQERSRRTCFKPGEVHGYAAQREQPVGSERVNRDGYVEVKVGEGLRSRPNRNFRLKHRVVYEQAYGSIPRGCNVVFADRDKRNFDPSNLVAVPRDLWSAIIRRRLEYWDAESLRTCMNIARVDRARHAAQCRTQACKRCGREFEPRYPHQRTCDMCLGHDETSTPSC